jgi:hypothetical protein
VGGSCAQLRNKYGEKRRTEGFVYDENASPSIIFKEKFLG